MQEPKKSKKSQDPVDEQLKKYGKGANNHLRYMSAGIQLVTPVLLGALVGYWIDSSSHNAKPIWTIILSSIMIVVGLYLFIRQFLQR
jgi:F0F1-type ATP synthase assembly protein I